MHVLAALLAAVVVGTWNGNYFPTGSSRARANPVVEDATVTAAAKMLAQGLDAIDPARTNDVVLCLNEIRRLADASNLVARIGRTNLVVATISGYHLRDRFDKQQDVIATTLPVVSAGWERFKFAGAKGKETPPRGYVYANLVFAPATTGVVYAAHLKSNYHAKAEEEKELNRRKRTHAIRQILGREKKLGSGRPVVFAGDLNADRWKTEFASEKIFSFLDEAGFLDLLGLLPPHARGTHPSKKWGDSALDYVFARGFVSVATPRIVPSEDLSDHNAVFTLLAPAF